MLVIKAPLRVSLFGGGTDIPEYFNQYGSYILSFSLSRSIYLVQNPRPTGGFRLSYSSVEELNTLQDAQHTLIHSMAHMYGPDLPYSTLSIISDLPKGTGLGSSSALAVALTQLAFGITDKHELVQRAFGLERNVSPVGIQDFLPCVYGGLKVYEIDRGANIKVTPAPLYLTRIINQYGMLLYTGMNRNANKILCGMKDRIPELMQIQSYASLVINKLDTLNYIALAEALTETWRRKRRLPGVSSRQLDAHFATALDAGACGGKLCGAGAGGCWFLIVPPGKRNAVQRATGLTEIPFTIGGSIEETSI